MHQPVPQKSFLRPARSREMNETKKDISRSRVKIEEKIEIIFLRVVGIGVCKLCIYFSLVRRRKIQKMRASG